MEKEVETAGKIVAAQSSGGFSNYKESVYKILGDSLSWLSTHQGLALIIILIILGVIIWLLLNAKKKRKQIENVEYTKNKEIKKKDALIEEQKNKLAALQKKLSDQQGVVSEALFSTLTTLTGYKPDQLQVFFNFLTQISENPLQLANTQATSEPGSQKLEEKGYDTTEVIDEKGKNAGGAGQEIESEDSAEENEEKEKPSPDAGPIDESEKLTEVINSKENNAPVAGSDDERAESSTLTDAKEKSVEDTDPTDVVKTNKN